MEPILRDVKTKIETERLILRMPEPGDGPVVNQSVRESIGELRPWLGFAQRIPSVEDTEANARQAHADFLMRKKFRFLVFLKESGDYVATTGFHKIDWDVPKVEIGYWINTRHSGQGFMVEAVGALTDYALDELNCARVEIRCESENDKSRAIPVKLGFKLEGILRNEDLSVDGKRLTDTCVYSKVPGDM